MYYKYYLFTTSRLNKIDLKTDALKTMISVPNYTKVYGIVKYKSGPG